MTVTVDINKLTDEQLSTICEKYGLRKPRAKDSPYHQVVRARAIRTAVKDFATKNEVPQKVINVVSTNKVTQVDDVWQFIIELKYGDKKVKYTVDVNTTSSDTVLK